MRFFIVGIVALLASPAFAQAPVLKFDEQRVIGVIQKPEIQIYITKQNLTPKYQLELKESFLPKIVESIEEKPF